MARYSVSIVLVATTLFFSLSDTVSAQENSQTNTFFSDVSIRINTAFISQRSGSSSVEFLMDEQNELLYQNPFFGIEMDYPVSDNIFVSAGFSYFGSKTTRKEGIIFIIAPEPDAITNFRKNYRLKNISLEPKAKALFKLKSLGFFWSVGPIFSAAFLNTDIDGATYSNPNAFSDFKESQSHSLGFGAQASTGLQYFITRNLGISAEVGYKYLRHKSLNTELEFSNDEILFGYKLNTFFQQFGIVVKL